MTCRRCVTSEYLVQNLRTGEFGRLCWRHLMRDADVRTIGRLPQTLPPRICAYEPKRWQQNGLRGTDFVVPGC